MDWDGCGSCHEVDEGLKCSGVTLRFGDTLRWGNHANNHVVTRLMSLSRQVAYRL